MLLGGNRLRGAETAASLGVEVLVEEDEVLPSIICGIQGVAAVAGATPGLIGQEELRQPRA